MNVRRYFITACRLALLLGTAALLLAVSPSAGAGPLPDPAIDAPLSKSPGQQSAVFAGGCFWGVQAVFEHVQGVTAVVSGYAGGREDQADYVSVSRGNTGHAESVRVDYDPSKISYGTLLKIFFAVAHDPTELNRQGPDVGTQYRSAIFAGDDQQRRIAAAYVAELERARTFSAPIVTRIDALAAFYPAEYYHQHYVARHPDNPYVMINDLPKLRQLKARFPALYRSSGTD
jgi:peptide-methionine (S)-S-oxide reductase